MDAPRTLLLLLACWAGQLVAQIAPGAWERVYPTPAAEWLHSIVWGAPGFVTVGDEREMLFSANGSSWERIVHAPIADPSYTDFSCVSFAGGSFFVPAGNGRLLRSQNGRVWTPLETGTALPLRCVLFANGQWHVFADSSQTMLVSSDLANWQARTLPADFRSVVEAGGQVVALGSNSLIYRTSDLVNWTGQTPHWAMYGFGPSIGKIRYGGGRYIAVGGYSNGGYAQIYYSTDAIAWTPATITPAAPGVLEDCTFANGRFTAVGSYSLLGSYYSNRTILTSVDGIGWQAISSAGGNPPDSPGLAAVAAQPGGKVVAVGGGGAIQVSDDGQNWTSIGSEIREYLGRVIFADGRFVAVGGRQSYIGGPPGGGAIFSSSDGQTWSAFAPTHDDLLADVAFGNGTWVVTGDDGGIFLSTDAVQWTDASISIGTHDLRHVVFGNGKFLAFARSRDLIYSSTNGVNWTSTDVPGVANLTQVKFLDGRFAAAIESGAVMFSTDGLTWTTQTTGLSDGINTIGFGKGRWVIGGYFSVGYSLDGIEWHTTSAPMQVYDLDYLDGRFVGVGNIATLITSADGMTWEPLSAPAVTTFDIVSIAHRNDTVVCAGGLSLYRAFLPRRSPWPSVPNFLAPEMIEFFGEPGREYRLLESDDLLSWHSVSDWRLGFDDYLIWNAPRSGIPSRFWRVERR